MNNSEINIDESIAAKYQRAQALIQEHTVKCLALNTTLYPIWIDGSPCFWYEREFKVNNLSLQALGREYRLVDAQAKTNAIAFDHAALAKVLSEVSKKKVDAAQLPINHVEMELYSSNTSIDLETQKVKALRFTAFDKRWMYETGSGSCTEIVLHSPKWEVSPDGKQAVFSRDYNLWVRNLETGEERALTKKGEENYIYGAPGTAWGMTVEPDPRVQARWSPDSKRIFTVQRDSRKVQSLPVVHHVPKDGSLRPQLKALKVAYPGETYLEELRLLSIEVDTTDIQLADYPQIPVTRNSTGFFTSKLGWWSVDSRRAYFVDVTCDYKTVRVIEFDTHTGTTRLLFEEHSETHINLMLNQDEYPTFVPLPESNEFLWFSERSGWAHLYLYDLETGQLKKPVTMGDWLVRSVVHIDPKRREAFIQTAGREACRDPYYRDLVRVNFDTGNLVTLVASDHDIFATTQAEHHTMVARFRHRDVRHSCAVHPRGDFAVVTQSRADEVPVSFLVDRDGEQVLELEVVDTCNLPQNWQWPEPVKLMAADGKTDTYGLVFRPSDFSSEKSYPVLSHGFNQPEIPIVSKGSFSNSITHGRYYIHGQALAELGFIVVQIDGRGSPCRSKAFYDECYGAFQKASHIDDHVVGIQQLAERYPYIDLDRVGIAAHMSGGSGCVEGMLHHPEFFKVGVTVCLHDRRLMPAAMMKNKYEGIIQPEGDRQFAENLVENLKGKLLLMNGMLDATTPPAGTFRLIEALQKANKDFDMLMLPNQGRGCNDYMLRRTWDYFVKHLLGVEPPKEFKLNSTANHE